MRRRNNFKAREMERVGQFAQRGFTLIELMCVIAIILILATISAGHYEKSVIRAKETTLHTDLKVMRDAIQHYTEDKEAAPSSLDDLVSAHYIQQIPTDPMTNAKDWVTASEEFRHQSGAKLVRYHRRAFRIRRCFAVRKRPLTVRGSSLESMSL